MAKRTGPYRQFEVVGPEDEPTQATRAPVRVRRSRLPVVVLAAVLGALLAAIAILLVLRTLPLTKERRREDPLVLYQVARELHGNGESKAALEILGRARRLATHARSKRQIDELRLQIELQPSLQAAQADMDAGRYDSARQQLSHVLSRDPGNEKAFLLMRLLQQRAAPKARARPVAAAPAAARQRAVTSPAPTTRRQPTRPRQRARVARKTPRRGRGPQAEPARPAPESSSADITSNAVGEVVKDGQATGQQTPAKQPRPVENRTSEASADPGAGAAPVRRPIVAPAVARVSPSQQPSGGAAEVPVQKPAAPTRGSVYVLADAPGYVFVDGVNTGKVTPVRLTLPAGPHEIVIVVQRTNERAKHQVQVKAGKALKVRFRLGSR